MIPIAFAAVAQRVAGRGWRPFPGLQETKVPAMRGWPGLNQAEWDCADLAAVIDEYQPAVAYCCCLAVQPEIAVIDIDITNLEHADIAARLADDILGQTPLVRIGLPPKCVRIYRNGGSVRSRKLHPLEIYSGSGQVVGFGWHQKAGRPYLWPNASPLDL
ncbi:MAG TPA: bifunctional DNA primase/polymerase, partial [Xanthobacteraceae bacterium]